MGGWSYLSVQPRQSRVQNLLMSIAAGLKSIAASARQPVRSEKKLMNVEHRTSNKLILPVSKRLRDTLRSHLRSASDCYLLSSSIALHHSFGTFLGMFFRVGLVCHFEKRCVSALEQKPPPETISQPIYDFPPCAMPFAPCALPSLRSIPRGMPFSPAHFQAGRTLYRLIRCGRFP